MFLFSSGDHDIGITEEVKHHIQTGDARPIKDEATAPRFLQSTGNPEASC